MHKILFLSDLHLCAAGETIIGLNPSARTKAVLDAAIADHADADAMILLGDLAHRGEHEAYRDLQRQITDLPMPVIPMMGNHDRRDVFLQVFTDAPKTAEGHIQHVFDLGNTRIITLDSLDGPPYVDTDHAGKICPARMAFLDTALAARDGRQAIVCIHHPPFDTGIAGMDKIKLTDGDGFLDTLAQHGNLHLICGHIHRTMSGFARGVPWSMFKSPCHQGVLDLQSPNSHLSSNEPGAYGIALLTQNGVVVHSEDVGLQDRQLFGGYTTKG
ncbi:metallophosphoesterase [Yoonia sp.]|uniref:metallophosphoesterase n=1 Tax=Yoonia sp. TaxID=2212373 RepID=UPI0035C83EF8